MSRGEYLQIRWSVTVAHSVTAAVSLAPRRESSLMGLCDDSEYTGKKKRYKSRTSERIGNGPEGGSGGGFGVGVRGSGATERPGKDPAARMVLLELFCSFPLL